MQVRASTWLQCPSKHHDLAAFIRQNINGQLARANNDNEALRCLVLLFNQKHREYQNSPGSAG